MKAVLRHTRISPKKANLVAGLVRLKPVTEALDILKFTPKKAAPLLAKVIKSAAANAENNFKQKSEDLYVAEIVVTKGATLKRYVPISRGRAHPVHKMTSHITVKIGVKTPEKAEKAAKPAKEEVKKSVSEAKHSASEKKTEKATKADETEAKSEKKETTKK